MKAGVIKRLVLDASIAVAWCFPEESTLYTEGVLDLLASGVEALTTAIWPFEVANALLVGERRKRLSAAQVTTVLQRISVLPIAIDIIQIDAVFGKILSVARQHQLTEYDAAYLELAVRERLPLATLDNGLRRAARNAGISLVTV
jgi:predicted nucleic acid-binding protein